MTAHCLDRMSICYMTSESKRRRRWKSGRQEAPGWNRNVGWRDISKRQCRRIHLQKEKKSWSIKAEGWTKMEGRLVKECRCVREDGMAWHRFGKVFQLAKPNSDGIDRAGSWRHDLRVAWFWFRLMQSQKGRSRNRFICNIKIKIERKRVCMRYVMKWWNENEMIQR